MRAVYRLIFADRSNGAAIEAALAQTLGSFHRMTPAELSRLRPLRVDVVTQFCFESTPILGWLAELGVRRIDLPVIIGLAGPATLATLTKFGLRCGIGNSMRALRGHISRFGRLLTDNGPDDVVRGLLAAPPAATAPIAGFHLFPFGGLRKSAAWLREFEHELQGAAPQDAAQNP